MAWDATLFECANPSGNGQTQVLVAGPPLRAEPRPCVSEAVLILAVVVSQKTFEFASQCRSLYRGECIQIFCRTLILINESAAKIVMKPGGEPFELGRDPASFSRIHFRAE